MSATIERIPLALAEIAAESFVREIRDVCLSVTVAGSIRRRRPDVGDLEIVAVPHVEPPFPDLFGDRVAGDDVDRLAERMEHLLSVGAVQHRLDKNLRRAFGSRFRRLVYQGYPLDLFSPGPESLGVILAIRTGPAAYSHRFVTRKDQHTSDGQRGLLPVHLQVKEGALRYRTSGEVIPTLSERSFFEAIGVPWVEPEARGAGAAREGAG